MDDGMDGLDSIILSDPLYGTPMVAANDDERTRVLLTRFRWPILLILRTIEIGILPFLDNPDTKNAMAEMLVGMRAWLDEARDGKEFH